MKSRRTLVLLAGVLAVVPGLLPTSSAAENGDWTTEYLKTAVTETIDRNLDGDVTGRTVVTDTKIEVRRKVTEITRVDSNGFERVVSRKTESYDSVAVRAVPIETVTESLETAGGRLVVMAVTTVTKTPKGQVTTYEKRDPRRHGLVVTKRTTSTINDLGHKIVTTEMRDKGGELVTTRTTTQRPQ